jgi:TfoX/Sxy family transcriptional regulator of competence genes
VATTIDFIEYVCEQIAGTGAVRYKKMFGEYMVYVNDKPVLGVCDNCVYAKPRPELAELLAGADMDTPYDGAKAHYIVDADDRQLLRAVVEILEPITPLPKPRKGKSGLEALPNIGPEVARQLNEAGITTPEELRAVGSREAWLRIQAFDSSACINRLQSLEGAVRGIKKKELDEQTKQSLKAFYGAHKVKWS